jgi:alanine racemase
MFCNLSTNKLVKITDGKLINSAANRVIEQISIDSRQIYSPAKTLFVALQGAKAKGESFIPALIELGVNVFLVPMESGALLEKNYPAQVFLLVSDTRKALQQIAKYTRDQFKAPLVGITGSNGKTIVKEWLAQILSQSYAVAKSPKSYNSQVGVPLSIFGIKADHQVAILEAGISKSGEMDALATMIKPNLGIFTNIGTAHQEGFSDLTTKLSEKLLLFQAADLIIYCNDQEYVKQQMENQFSPDRRIAWSDRPGTTYTRSLKVSIGNSRLILMKEDLSTNTFQLPFSDAASLENITHVIIAALTLGQDSALIQSGINHLKPVDMRLTLKTGVNDSLIIDDTYTNDLAGLKVALDFMQQQRPKRKRILILSDILQQGHPEQLYQEVLALIDRYRFDEVYGVGTEIKLLEKGLGSKFSFFDSTEGLLSGVDPNSFANDLILITGARSFGFERIVNRLQQRVHGTSLEINLNALTHNFNFYKRKLNPITKVMVMVKAFAYGGGATEIANHLQTLGADYLAVAFTDEGVSLRKEGIRLPIMVLNPAEESFYLCQEFDLEPVVFSISFYQSLAEWCMNQDFSLKIHLDLDTGMHRLGFEMRDMQELERLIRAYPRLEIASIYTHLVGADEEIHKDFSLSQLEKFNEMKEKIIQLLDYSPICHALNSAGIVAFPAYQFDMVRLGIGLYGVEVTGRFGDALQPISILKTTISQVKTLDPGETVGYSRKGSLPNGGKIATLSIGYADGYDRRFSNGKGYVLIQGKKAPVIGNVCMDMVMVDISEIEAQAGDEAIIYGPDISLKDLADRIGTIPYELLTNISTRVKRVYYLD